MKYKVIHFIIEIFRRFIIKLFSQVIIENLR